MSRPTKPRVIEELKSLGVPFDEASRYNDLCNLLKKEKLAVAEAKTLPSHGISHARVEEKVELVDPLGRFPAELVKRAEDCGLRVDQIVNYTDPAALTIMCDQLKPLATAYSGVKRVVRPHRRPKGEPAQVTMKSEISELRASHVARYSYDEGQLHEYCRRNRIDLMSIIKLTFERFCVPTGSTFTTEIIIDYLKG